MKLARVLLRSYRSFNLDFDKKLETKEAQFGDVRRPWEEEDFKSWRPFVEIGVSPHITPVVGANESGKSYLLDAIELVIAGRRIEDEEVCRYSSDYENLFAGGYAAIGLGWKEFSPDQTSRVWDIISPAVEGEERVKAPKFREMMFLRRGVESELYLLGKDVSSHHLTHEQAEEIRKMLPPVIRMRPDLKLPMVLRLDTLIKEWFERHPGEDPTPYLGVRGEPAYQNITVLDEDRFAFDMLMREGGLSEKVLFGLKSNPSYPAHMLENHARDVTANLDKELNLNYWWEQDSEVKLHVAIAESQLRLNLTDRTDKVYGFSERSRGLQYFLGYLIQFISQYRHLGQPSLVLSDEPDYALSIMGQQDLLRTIDKLSAGGGGHPAHQVLYSTHSPFLIDKNFPKRIVALHKGIYDEGTTVIGRPYQRMFEPLRTALGMPAIGIPFMDAANIVVEGISDQTFIVGMSQYFASIGAPHLNLNAVAIVIAGGASNIPAVVASARPPLGQAYVTVLLDSDEHGIDACNILKRDYEELGKEGQVLLLGDHFLKGAGYDVELEDLIPLPLYHVAFKRRHGDKLSDARVAPFFSMASIEKRKTDLVSIASAYESVFREYRKAMDDDKTLPLLAYDKDGIIETLMSMLNNDDSELTKDKKAFPEMVETMRQFSFLLDDRVTKNREKKKFNEIRKAISDWVTRFLTRNPAGAEKGRALELLRNVQATGHPIDRNAKVSDLIDCMIDAFALETESRRDEVPQYEDFAAKIRDLPKQYTR